MAQYTHSIHLKLVEDDNDSSKTTGIWRFKLKKTTRENVEAEEDISKKNW